MADLMEWWTWTKDFEWRCICFFRFWIVNENSFTSQPNRDQKQRKRQKKRKIFRILIKWIPIGVDAMGFNFAKKRNWKKCFVASKMSQSIVDNLISDCWALIFSFVWGFLASHFSSFSRSACVCTGWSIFKIFQCCDFHILYSFFFYLKQNEKAWKLLCEHFHVFVLHRLLAELVFLFFWLCFEVCLNTILASVKIKYLNFPEIHWVNLVKKIRLQNVMTTLNAGQEWNVFAYEYIKR